MTDTLIPLLTILGIVIIVILLVLIFLLLRLIRKQQKNILDSSDILTTSIEELQNGILTMDSIITANFKENSSKLLVIDAKQISIKDTVDLIDKGVGDIRNNIGVIATGIPEYRDKQNKPTGDIKSTPNTNKHRKHN